jgi:DNA-binding PadR family transcriptional regulator
MPADSDAALHGYAIARKIQLLSNDELQVEEGSLYPALQKLLIKGFVKAEWDVSDSGRKVRVHRLTPAGRKQLGICSTPASRALGAEPLRALRHD